MLNRILMELYDEYEKKNIKPLLDFANKTFSDEKVSSFFTGCVLILFSRPGCFKPRYNASKENLYDIVLSANISIKDNNLLLFYVERLNTVKGIKKYFRSFTSTEINECANVVIDYLEQFKPRFLKEIEGTMFQKIINITNVQENCKCCKYIYNFKVLFENDTCVCVADENNILIGACYIIPKNHIETPFSLSDKEWKDTKELINIVKNYLDKKYKPDGYNLGWNIGPVGGQYVLHCHLHVIPRYKDEPLAGKGVRHWLMQEENKRPNV